MRWMRFSRYSLAFRSLRSQRGGVLFLFCQMEEAVADVMYANLRLLSMRNMQIRVLRWMRVTHIFMLAFLVAEPLARVNVCKHIGAINTWLSFVFRLFVLRFMGKSHREPSAWTVYKRHKGAPFQW